MTSVHKEVVFETAIEAHLLVNGYLSADTYEADLALDPGHLFAFISATQPGAWAKYVTTLGGEDAARSRLVSRLASVLGTQGSLEVLRGGVSDYGVTFRLSYPKPAAALAPEVQALYDANRVSVKRQVPIPGAGETVDLVLFVNGIPVVTAELKARSAGQSVEDAVAQYQKRNPDHQLFRYAERALVHFAVDEEAVAMATRLAGAATRFLPFNKGRDGGAGNPDNPAGYKTSYLWEQVWQRDSLLDLVQRFVNVTYPPDTKKKDPKRGTHVFPRYHQWDVVRKLEAHARENGPGHSYLVQHSAGSGKSNSIAWAAHRLYSLHDSHDRRVFHSVVVITDRRVLDQQLQDTIYGIEHQHGVVHRIDKDSRQLADALATQAPVIITTLQKFPVVMERIGALPERNYAVIIDEAHSSQTGKAAHKLREVLTRGGIADLPDPGEEGTFDVEEAVLRVIETAGPQPNLSFLAFTATPKAKTLEMFGEATPEGKRRPFHLYSMRQAIEEGFILDVLSHYTTYERFFQLTKEIEDDPRFESRSARRAVARFVDLHPTNLAQKAEIVVEHFRRHVQDRIGGKAKGIVVSRSRRSAYEMWRAIRDYCAANQYDDIGALVAFSGSLDDGAGGTVSEASLNGFSERELPARFDGDGYRLLVVAEKYQTGFDQPKLLAMYVDKKLDGVHAVQTLSRLNRTMPGKDKPFVLDFVNDAEDIRKAFEPYYETTVLESGTDPALLYDLKRFLDAWGIYWPDEVEAFAAVFFKPKPSPPDQAALSAIVDTAVGRYRDEYAEPEQVEFVGQLDSYLRMYGFLTHVVSFSDTGLEKLFAYGQWLRRKLPSTADVSLVDLAGDIDLAAMRHQLSGTVAIELEEGTELSPPAVGGRQAEDSYVSLSELIARFNDLYGTDFTEADMLLPEAVHLDMVADDRLADQAKANTPANFRIVYEDAYKDALFHRKDRNEDVFLKTIGNPELLQGLMDAYFQLTYDKLREHQPAPDLIAAGESATVEFKSSARWSTSEGKVHAGVEDAFVKTVAGFLNAEGGTLLIGVQDRTGRLLGVDADVASVRGKDLDGYENWMTDRLISSLTPGTTSVAKVAVSFPQIDGTTIARIDVAPSPDPVYAKTSKSPEVFFVRVGNSTRQLTPSETVAYVRDHWPP